MTKVERAIIDKFLAENELYCAIGETERVHCIADIENAKKEWENKLAKDRVVNDLAESYKGKISRDILAPELLADMAMDMLGIFHSFERYPHKMHPDKYEKLLRLIRVLGDALAKEFPAINMNNGGR